MDTPENARVRRFRFLTEAEFNVLSAEEKMAYLKAALKERQQLAGSPQSTKAGVRGPSGK